ncbi:sodium-dependent bicarbonate transport family permease [Leptospira levettii]|uniref:sodium-dependent bicarbonate transport family permease n=1 Tax=Leptospira levettii TaxID=2023178 RepID=UPI000C2B1DAC|nr:sodium-dependent bicarbonate transport family permease [Leptospira levettii]PJZ36421.1 sodium-dependent bicarbonate transport family permease [Leptospira levettii]PJZ87704.1 sodium-dependent bicarbonate transport family permease [Leptospira levettii]
MDILHALVANLQTPMFLAFLLGIIATIIKSDLKFPDGMYTGLTIYLLFAIGLKGGVKLSNTTLVEFYKPAMAALLLCISIPLIAYGLLTKFGKYDKANAAALAAHYGSVSAVTFSEALAFLDSLQITYEGFMPSMLAIMEIPAILVALLLVKMNPTDKSDESSWGKILHELLTGKGTLLLLGGLIIGMISGKKGHEQFAPLFETPFRGMLILFLLEVGIVTGRRLTDLKKAGIFLIGFGILFPIVTAMFGLYLGKSIGLSMGGAMVLGTLSASASYIAAPAAVRIAIPEASPAIYLTASLAITFPFNLSVGLPFYLTVSKYLYGV